MTNTRKVSHESAEEIKSLKARVLELEYILHAIEHGKIDALRINHNETELVKVEEDLKSLASFDHLTKLPNRYLFELILAKSMERARRNKSLLALIYIDIDYFKNVNDFFGHETGDLFLKMVVERLKQNIRVGDFVARLGADEFTIICEDMPSVGAVSLAAEQLVNEFKRSFIIGDHEILSTISIGISICAGDEKTVKILMKHAEQALYQTKKTHRNGYTFYDDMMQQKLDRYMLIVNHLRHALQKNEFELFYQPKIDVQTHSIVGIEALLRWNNPYIGVICPDEFIPIAEESGLIIPIGTWVIEKALQQYNEWRKYSSEVEGIKLSINISAAQLDTDDLDTRLMKLFKKSNISPKSILFEITETAMMKKTLTSKSILRKKLVKLGVGISIDDFGTGYSSLTYLKQLPVKELKIDKSFIHDIDKNKTSEAIVKAIIELAKTLNLDTVAEGVETKKQVAFLTKNKCNLIQGFYFSKPLSTSDMTTYIRKNHAVNRGT